MRRLFLVTAAIVAAVFLWVSVTLPPRPREAAGAVEESLRRRTVAGALHVHSLRSDGSQDSDGIAAAAARAGLRFVILTDHGDGTRAPDPPSYRSGVLVIDAVEISSAGGHYVALDMPAAPYPLGGQARAVVEDVRRLGGFGIAAHPDSRKPELRWVDWSLPIDGVEWLSLDSEWRDESRARLARVVADYVLRSAPALASILDRPATLDRWDAKSGSRVVALPAHDAHGGALEGSGGWLSIPSYVASFETFALRAVLHTEPTGDAGRDARLLLDAIRAGRVFSAIDAIAAPAFIDFRLTHDSQTWGMGDLVPVDRGRIIVTSTLPADGRIVLVRGGRELASSAAGTLTTEVKERGAYRVEVRVPYAPGEPAIPWLVTNPIYLGAPVSDPVPPSAAYEIVAVLTGPALLEKDPRSVANVTDVGGTHALDFTLASGERTSQYAALAIPVSAPAAPFDSVSFAARAREPMRISVQLRFNALGGARWTRSVYVSPEGGEIVVPVRELVPAGTGPTAVEFRTASSVLFVVDLTNARPGYSGRFEISNLRLTATR